MNIVAETETERVQSDRLFMRRSSKLMTMCLLEMDGLFTVCNASFYTYRHALGVVVNSLNVRLVLVKILKKKKSCSDWIQLQKHFEFACHIFLV